MPKQDVTVELYYDGAWHDLVANDDVFAEQPIIITRGDGDESAAPRPATVSMRLANDDDMYRTSNPESPLYGKAGLNTPTKVAVGGTVRGVVEASAWKAGQSREFRRTPKRGKAWVDVEGGGLLQRAGQWTEPLKSPFRQYNEGLAHSVGYWPLEQARGSTSLFSPTPGARQIVMQNVAFDSQFRPPGSAPLMDIGDDPAEAGAYFVRDTTSSTAGWQLSWVARYGPLVAGEQDIFDWETADGTAYGLYLDSTTGEMIMYSSLAGVPVLNGVGGSYNGYDWSQWTLFSIDAQYSAGTLTTNVYFNWTNADNTQSGFINVGFSGVPSNLTWWDASTFAGVPPNSTIGHVFGTNVDSTGGVDLFSGDRIDAWTGYLGELAAVRFARLCNAKGLLYYVSAGWASSYPMGPQPVATFPELLREIRDTEDGLIYDHRSEARLYFLCRADRINQTPALTLTPADLPALPDEVTDDLPVHNLITASQRDGGEYTVEDSTSLMGTQAPPDGRGEYKQTVDVNVADPDNDLPQVANWWLYRGTVALPRFPKVTINLAALDADKVAEVEAVDVGSVITIDGYREYTIRLYVLGYTETIGTHARSIVFTCAPDQQFDVGVYDTARYDSGSTVTHRSYTVGVNTLVFRTSNSGDLWWTAGSYDCVCSGERFTVDVMGPDGTFEAAGLPGWDSAINGTWARSTTVAHTGTGSGLLTVVGSPTQTYVRQPAIPVTVGVSYRITMWAYSVAGASNILAVIDWLDSGGGYLSSSSQSLTLAAATWTPFDVTGVAPASTAYAQYGPTIGSSPTAGTAIYVDDIHFQQASGDVGWLQVATVKRAVNGIRKTLPAGEPIHVATPGRYAL